ncbi:hypothetical protein PHAVU_002G323404 [Phaseolus vulgaris]
MFSTSEPRFRHVKLERQRQTFSRYPHQKLGHQRGNFSRFPHVILERQRQTFSRFHRQKPDMIKEINFSERHGAGRRGEPRAYSGHIFPTSSEIFSITFDRYNEEEEVANNTIYLEVLTKFMKDSGHVGRSSGAHLRRHSHTGTTFILVPFGRASTTEFAQLPSSFCNFVNLRSLELQKYTDIESLSNSIVNLKLLSKLDCSGCPKLTEIPRHIGRLTLLMELSLRDSGIVNLPESIAHLSSLKSLDLSDCKKLECIPQIPPFLK